MTSYATYTSCATYTSKALTRWNKDRRGEIELDAIASVYLGDAEITGRDRIAFALRELRKRGYDVEPRPADWTKPLMICSAPGSKARAFGDVPASRLHDRLDKIARRHSILENNFAFFNLLGELYDEALHYDMDCCDALEEPYVFTFKGDPALVEAVFQATGLTTQHGLLVTADGSETLHYLAIAPALW